MWDKVFENYYLNKDIELTYLHFDQVFEKKANEGFRV